MARKDLIGQSGQTIVEYIFMLSVMITLITSTLSWIKTRYLGDMTKCESAANKRTLLCKISTFVSDPGNGNKKFQYYPFKK
jgi:hypothetical protein